MGITITATDGADATSTLLTVVVKRVDTHIDKQRF